MSFISFPGETLGMWHEMAINQIKKIDKALATSKVHEESEAVCHRFQRLRPPGQCCFLHQSDPPLAEVSGVSKGKTNVSKIMS